MTDTTGTAMERPLVAPAPVMTHEERESTFKIAKALAESGFFKDSRGADQALAKVLIGRDLGLTPAESMSALHVFDGKVEASADFHATRVRQRDGYDYEVEWVGTRDTDAFGCKLTFYGPHRGEQYQQLGVSEFTVADAKAADLYDKPGKNSGPGVWKLYTRNMCFARAMSNGVAWYCPEVMGSVRVYSPGEAEAAATPTVGIPAAEADISVLDSIPAVRDVVARAQQVGHAGLANVATVEMQIRDQPEEFVADWVARATAELDRAEAEAAQVQDADVVPDEDHPEPFLATDPGGRPHARAQELRQQSAEAAVAGDADAAERHLQEAEALEAQGTLGGEGE